MENRDWLNDYVSLKQVNPVSPFTVPAGYFDSLEERIVSAKKLDELKISTLSDGFTIPENYFEHLTDNIQSRVYIDEYLSGTENNFSVPEGYFENLGQQIQSRIAVEETTGGPDIYFTVPDGYFDQLNTAILNKTVNIQDGRKKGIVRRIFASTAIKYATAACFAVAIGGGILINVFTNPVYVHTHSFLHKELSAVPSNELESYLQLNVDAGDTQHMILTGDAQVDDNKLNNALQDYVDSVQ